MNKSAKIKLLAALAFFGGALVLSSCTASFCSNRDAASIAYAYEQGVTVYCDKDEVPEEYREEGLSWPVYPEEGNDNLYAYIPVNADGTYAATSATYLNTNIIAGATSNSYAIPTYNFWKELDQKVLDKAIETAQATGSELFAGLSKATVTAKQVNPYVDPNPTAADAEQNPDSILRLFGYVKFYGDEDTRWGYFDTWVDEIDKELGIAASASDDFLSFYKTQIDTTVNANRSCIATVPNSTINDAYGHYGPSGNWEVSMTIKDWGYAWGKGPFEGLIVYPVAWLVDTFAVGIEPALTGIGQIVSIILVTFIVRAVVQLVTLKSTLDQQRTQALQPQIAKLQAKYPNSNTNKAEQQRLSQEQMMLYKRNHINPLSMLLVLVFQFPIFICVWGALQGSAVLTSGQVLGVQLSSPISSILFDFNGEWYLNSNGWWTALVLFLVMAGLQFLAMMLPQWITKRRNRKLQKLSANPAADKNAKTMKWVNIIMLVVTIVMGFSLPAAMGVYWAIGALISMLQTAITQYFMGKKMAKQKKGI